MLPAGFPRANTSACARRSWRGSFPFPVKYGYATVGVVEAGPAGADGPQRLCAASRIRPSSTCRPRPSCRCRTTCRCRARCWRPTWRRRSTRPGMRRRARPERIAVVGAGVSARWSAFSARGFRAREVTLIDIDPARGELARALGVDFAAPEDGAGRLRFRVSRQRHGGRACHRAPPRRRRGDHRRTELVRRRRPSRCRSAARSTAAA